MFGDSSVAQLNERYLKWSFFPLRDARREETPEAFVDERREQAKNLAIGKGGVKRAMEEDFLRSGTVLRVLCSSHQKCNGESSSHFLRQSDHHCANLLTDVQSIENVKDARETFSLLFLFFFGFSSPTPVLLHLHPPFTPPFTASSCNIPNALTFLQLQI